MFAFHLSSKKPIYLPKTLFRMKKYLTLLAGLTAAVLLVFGAGIGRVAVP